MLEDLCCCSSKRSDLTKIPFVLTPSSSSGIQFILFVWTIKSLISVFICSFFKNNSKGEIKVTKRTKNLEDHKVFFPSAKTLCPLCTPERRIRNFYTLVSYAFKIILLSPCFLLHNQCHGRLFPGPS